MLSVSKQSIIGLLQEDTFISLPASLTFVKSVLLLADILPLQVVEDSEHCSSAVEPFNLLVLAHKLTIKAVSTCRCISKSFQQPSLFILEVILSVIKKGCF